MDDFRMDQGEEYYFRYLNGEAEALEHLISLYRRGLTLFLYGLVGDLTEAENLMIDTFAQLVICQSKFQRRSSLKTYLFTIARNLANKERRKRKMERILCFQEVEQVPGENVFALSERKLVLFDAMEQLPEKYRQVLMLLYFEEMNYEQAAQVMHQNRKQITNLAYRAKQALKQLLQIEELEYNDR